ncbi:hypothetical protein [Melittangium boletus]|uniref:HEAT repeat domain-containing protein n=1 Tax=Melittangium boletus DSM 14713 TaxID=1294270 RepID=A0A250IID5_9BACT|nr:hypothetical protein [Melittangium boletus]ATB30917.1 hypothetical protein MEBOL_004379 [Melittangium boletus DSM 14713]
MTPDAPPRSSASPERAPSPRGPRIALALGAVALLAAVALLTRGTGDTGPSETPPAPTSGAASAAPAPAPQAPAGPAGPEQKAPRFSQTTCWRDLERFNESVTLETFRDWAKPLLASRDPHVLAYLKERLAELIGGDEGRALEVLEWAREATPAEFKLFMAGVRGAPALLQPRVVERVMDLGLDEKMDLGRRAGFLDSLQKLPRLEPAQLDRLTHFAKDAASGEAGWITTRAIGRVMKEDMERTGNVKPYLDKLLTIGTESQDEPVRYLALEMEMHADAPLDARTTQRLAQMLTTEGSDEVRQVVAHDLSLAEDKKQVLDIYAKAFATERNLCVRWALFRFSARAAGKDALPVMANMALIDPRFQANYQDIERLYASGIVDYDRIWFGLPSQDPHGCLDHHDD